MKIRETRPRAVGFGFAPSLLLLNLLAAPALAQNDAAPKPTAPATTPAPQDANQTPPQSVPTVAPIPTTPPPTGLQAPPAYAHRHNTESGPPASRFARPEPVDRARTASAAQHQ